MPEKVGIGWRKRERREKERRPTGGVILESEAGARIGRGRRLREGDRGLAGRRREERKRIRGPTHQGFFSWFRYDSNLFCFSRFELFSSVPSQCVDSFDI